MEITRIERNHASTLLIGLFILAILVIIISLPLKTKTVIEANAITVTELYNTTEPYERIITVNETVTEKIKPEDIDFSLVELSDAYVKTEDEKDYALKEYFLELEEKFTGCFIFEYEFVEDEVKEVDDIEICLENEDGVTIILKERVRDTDDFDLYIDEAPEIFEENKDIPVETTIVELRNVTKSRDVTTYVNETKQVRTWLFG